MAPLDLGLGSDLANQVKDDEEERRKKRLGQTQTSPAVQQLFGYGMAGVAPMQLGLAGVGRR
jgi:hypothetical protein